MRVALDCGVRMRILPARLPRVDNITRHNKRYPQHASLNQAAPGYTFSHAHSHASTRGVTGPLPKNLEISYEFISSVIADITPAEKNWAERRDHVFQKDSFYSDNRSIYESALEYLVGLIKDANLALIEAYEDEEWEFRVSRQSLITLNEVLSKLVDQQKSDYNTAYINLPFLILVAVDTLGRLVAYVDAPWAEEAFKDLELFLTFPASTLYSYNLNVIYHHRYQKADGREADLPLLAGFRLGKCKSCKDRSGRNSAAIRLEKVTITTLHHKRREHLNSREGFLCELKIVMEDTTCADDVPTL